MTGQSPNSTHLVGTVDPRTGAWALVASIAASDEDVLGGAAAYVPGKKFFIFNLGVGSAIFNFRVNMQTGRVDSARNTAAQNIESMAYNPRDGLIHGLGIVVGNGSYNRSIVALNPDDLSIATRGIVQGFWVESGGISALYSGGGRWSALYWIGAAVGTSQPLFLITSNLCDGSSSVPLDPASGLPVPLCGGDAACPWSLEFRDAPAPPPAPPPEPDCSFADSYPQQYVAYKLEAPGAPIVVDGRLDEPAWAEVSWSRPFVDVSTTTPPALASRVKVRWDDEFLYVGGAFEDPHAWANITSTCHCIDPVHDQHIYDDNDFEVFVDADGSCHYYKELEINAANATWDICLDRPYENGGHENSTRALGPAGWDFPLPVGLPGTYRAAVHVNGALNDPSVAATGWSIEMALPLASLAYNTTATVPLRAGDYWRALFAREQWAVAVVGGRYWKEPCCQSCATPGAPAVDNWAWTRQPRASFHMPEAWGFLQFAAEPVNATPVVRSSEWPGRSIAAAAYYAQQGFAQDHCGAFTARAEELLPYLGGGAAWLLDGTCSAAGHRPVALAAYVDAAGTPRFNVTVPPTAADPLATTTVTDERLFRVHR